MVFADEDGNIYDHPELEMAGRSGTKLIAPDEVEVIPMPPHTRFFTMPGRMPVGWDPKRRRYEALDEMFGGKCYPVAAFLPPGYTRTLLPASMLCDMNCVLPLWAYTAVGWMEDQFWVAAVRMDEFDRWNPEYYDEEELAPRIESFLREYPENRLIKHLARCATEYHCFNAMNLFYRRWECGIPTSPACNARCVGCLSWQPAESCPSSQERIDFVPGVDEIVEIALPHLEEAEGAIVSFGQGCEGEPLLQSDLIAEAIERLRSHTDRGTIHINTNGSIPKKVEQLCKAGLNSIRISLNSARPQFYHRYYKPKGYTFDDVTASLKVARSHGLFVSINLLVYPGFTDSGDELWALMGLIEEVKPDMIQMRNLNIDPELYLRSINYRGGPGIGITRLMKAIKEEFPDILFGYFNRPKEMFR
jgi:pyruvate-formate lyase-activating enzyme